MVVELFTFFTFPTGGPLEMVHAMFAPGGDTITAFSGRELWLWFSYPAFCTDFPFNQKGLTGGGGGHGLASVLSGSGDFKLELSGHSASGCREVPATEILKQFSGCDLNLNFVNTGFREAKV